MAVQNKVLYTFRGWIAFVAFMDMGAAGRSYIERRSFLSRAETRTDVLEDDFLISRLLGMYCLLKALALTHCTLYIHYKPVVSMGIWSLVLTIILYLTETIYYHSATFNFYVVFPLVLNTITLIGLLYLPGKLKIWIITPGSCGVDREIDDENSQILRQMGTYRKRKYNNHIKNKNV